jgi:tyrosyl-tRNA synthetase
LLSDLSSSEIEILKGKVQSGEVHPKDAKKLLARELTARFHGEELAFAAEDNFENVFKKGGLPEDLPEYVCRSQATLPQLLVQAALVASTSEARRMIQQGAVTIDGERADDIHRVISPSSGGQMLIKVGKRRFCRILFS